VGLWWRCCCLRRVFNEVLVFEWVVCEHTNSRVKKFQIWGSEFRDRLRFYDVMTEVVCGFVNF
jgi:hypothetical protein